MEGVFKPCEINNESTKVWIFIENLFVNLHEYEMRK